jgi:Ni/Fe-hydrogenase subunit HybB-like protein
MGTLAVVAVETTRTLLSVAGEFGERKGPEKTTIRKIRRYWAFLAGLAMPTAILTLSEISGVQVFSIRVW